MCDRQRQLFMPLEVEEEELEEPADDTVSTPISTTAANTTRADKIWAQILDCLIGPTRLPLRKQSNVSDTVKVYLTHT